MRFDTIVVPRGAEARAVERGWPAARADLLRVDAGRAAGRNVARAGRPIAAALVMGLCGALDPALRLGDCVVYERISDGGATIELDASLAADCAAALRCATVGALNVGAVVGQVAQKAALRKATGAQAIDMEAAALAEALHARGARVAMVRVVSDDAQGELPDLHGVYTPDGGLRPLALSWAFLRAPRRSAAFIGNVMTALRALRAAAAGLAAAAEP